MSLSGSIDIVTALSLVVLLLLLNFVVKYLWSRRDLYYYASKINGPFAFPIIGSVHLLLKGTDGIFENILKLVRQYRPLGKLWCGHNLVILLSRPEDVDTILNNSLERGPFYQFLRPVFGNGLFVRPVGEWKRHRRVIAPTFNQHIMNTFVEIFASYSNSFVEKLQGYVKTGHIDIFPLVCQCSLDITCHTAMGTKVDAMREDNQLIAWISRMAELGVLRMFNVFLHPDLIWKLTPYSKEAESITVKFDAYVHKIIEHKRSQRLQKLKPTSDFKRKIFLDYLIEQTEQEGGWSNEELKEETRTFIISSSDAISNTVSFTLMMLGMHPEVQQKVYEELCTIFDDDRDASVDDLPKMVYLDRVIKETLRLFPPAVFIGRYLEKNVTLKEHTLPKGCSVLIPIYYLHRDEDSWENPLKFDPDRFLPEEAGKIQPNSYIPFSAGPRNCIGFRFGLMCVKTMLSTILRRYKVVGTPYSSISDIRLKFDFATKCLGGYQIELGYR